MHLWGYMQSPVNAEKVLNINTSNQGGRQQKIISRAVFGDDDVVRDLTVTE